MFEPGARGGRGPSGLADWPRPFVFRVKHLDGRTVAAGQNFHFEVNLFEKEARAAEYLALTFAQLAREGLGPDRRRVQLIQVEPAPLVFDLGSCEEKVTRLRVRFITPTELKSGEQLAARPEFGILAARLRDRISTLRELYGEGPLPLDFHSFGERAQAVSMLHCDVSTLEFQRRSSRTGQVHSIGGFTGVAEYSGPLSEFVPYLKVGKWVGVGRQTVWGKGEIEASIVPPV